MKTHFILSFFFLLFSANLSAQHRVQFLVTDQSIIKPKDSIYISGTFDQWDSTKNKSYLLQRLDPTHFTITLQLTTDFIQYKFHRGSWLTVETNPLGIDIDNRKLFTKGDTIIKDTISGWRDDFVVGNLPRFLSKFSGDSDRIDIFVRLTYRYADDPKTFNLDTALWCVQQALDLMKHIKNQKLIYGIGLNLWMWRLKDRVLTLLDLAGNYSKELETALQYFQEAEQTNDTVRIIQFQYEVSDIYGDMHDWDDAISYARKGRALLSTRDSFWNYWSTYALARYFFRSNQQDSALHYAQQSYELGLKKSDTIKAENAETLGDIYSARNEDEIAMSFYHKALHFEKILWMVSRSKRGIAKLYQKKGNIDSALYYATESWNIYQQNKNDFQMNGYGGDDLETGELLSELYRKNHQYDSAYRYLLITTGISDSLFSAEKVRQEQNLTFNESLRQEKLEEDRAEQAEQRKRNLQIIGIAIFIPAFFLFILLLRRRKVNARVISFLGILSLLLVFEFIMMLLDPFLKQWTNNVPVFMLAFLVVLAAILIPAHHRIEAWLKTKLTHQAPKLEELATSETVKAKQ